MYAVDGQVNMTYMLYFRETDVPSKKESEAKLFMLARRGEL